MKPVHYSTPYPLPITIYHATPRLQRLCKGDTIFNLLQHTSLRRPTNGAFTFHALLIIPHFQHILFEPRINLLELFQGQCVDADILFFCESDTGSAVIMGCLCKQRVSERRFSHIFQSVRQKSHCRILHRLPERMSYKAYMMFVIIQSYSESTKQFNTSTSHMICQAEISL